MAERHPCNGVAPGGLLGMFELSGVGIRSDRWPWSCRSASGPPMTPEVLPVRGSTHRSPAISYGAMYAERV